ncbi:MAG: sensor histidine kinase [Gemmatimonadales bacterium]
MVGVSVRDTGPGIAPEQLERIFDRFFRIDQSRSRAHGGAGLGLAIARLLAELQGGRVEVESIVGTGSTFTVGCPEHPRPCPHRRFQTACHEAENDGSCCDLTPTAPCAAGAAET